jgi:hypothetical protein
VPFIRQTRDKRGFEYTYVMHTYHPGAGGQQRPRLLYLFRSPASVRLGRSALDAEVMEALEHTHPDLSFDWQSLSREATVTRADNGQDRPPQHQNRRPQQQSRPEPLPTDDTVLGRVLGAGEAARMRRRYAELQQRIARRSRTPEERDRLNERLKRLNPEDWTDEAAVRANAPAADAGWNAIGAELPSRRRGRRGGRGREAGPRPSGIMASEGRESPEAGNDGPEETHDPGDRDAGGDDSAVGPVETDPDPET